LFLKIILQNEMEATKLDEKNVILTNEINKSIDRMK
jgi:hypothetical protein